MSYEDREGSVREGRPVEVFAFYMAGRGWFYTSADQDVVINDRTYRSVAIQRGDIESNEESGSSSVDVVLDRSLSLASSLIAYNPPEPIWLLIYRLHRDEGSPIVQFQGQVSSINSHAESITLHCSSVHQVVEKKVPRMKYQRVCNNVLYDRVCQVPLEDHMATADVTSVDGTTITLSWTSGFHPDWDPFFLSQGWASAGFIKVVDTGHRGFVVDHFSHLSMRLLAPVPGLEIGSQIEVYAGCDRSPGTCRDKFDNLQHFIGFPDIPEFNPFGGRVV